MLILYQPGIPQQKLPGYIASCYLDLNLTIPTPVSLPVFKQFLNHTRLYFSSAIFLNSNLEQLMTAEFCKLSIIFTSRIDDNSNVFMIFEYAIFGLARGAGKFREPNKCI